MTRTAVPLHAGSLASHRDTIAAEIRRHPGDANLRAQLFQVLAAQGEWKRAAEQVRLCAELNPQAAPTALMYDRAIAAERQREAVLAGRAQPAMPGPRPAWLDMLLDALQCAAKDRALAAALRTQAMEAAEPLSGTLACAEQDTPTPFSWICDGDSRLGPVFEFIQGEHYDWLPFSYLRSVRLLPPEGLADMVWAQAELTLADARVLHALIPARYPAPVGQRMADQEDRIKLGRLTQWEPLHGETYTGVGQKMWMTDQGEYALLDTRALEHA
jgi:type VI secretion system protein ImpE